MIQKNTSPRLVRKRQQRLEGILEQALELVLEQGLEGLTMQALATRLDYAVGALYRYFKSKDALLAALQRQVLADFGLVLQAAAACGQAQWQTAAPAPRALAQIVLAAEAYLALRQAAPTRFHLLQAMIVSPKQLLSLQEGLQVLQVAGPLLKRVHTLFAQAEQVGALSPGPADRRAVLFWAALQGLLPLEKLTRFVPGYRLEVLQVELLQTLLQGWGASPAVLATAGEMCGTLLQTSEYQAVFLALHERRSP